MAEAEKQGSIFQEMAARRSRSDELNERAVEQGVSVADIMVTTDSGSEGEELAMSPAFEMEELTPTGVSENEIREDSSNEEIENVDTPAETLNEGVVADNPLEESSNDFDSSNEGAASRAEAEPIEETFPSEAPLETAPEGEAAASPSYFETLDDAAADTDVSFEEESAFSETPSSSEEQPDFGPPPIEEPAPIPDESAGSESPELGEEPGSFPLDETPDVPDDENSVAEELDSLDVAAPEPPRPSAREVEEGRKEPETDLEEVEEESAKEPLGQFEEPVAESLGESEEVEDEPVDENAAQEVEPKESASAREEDLIDQSEGLLADEPEPIADAEVIMAAEELVDRIGPVVDIRNLPKTQPSRVLSKTTKNKEAEPAKEKPVPIAEPEENKPKATEKKQESEGSGSQESSPASKKKKKKISLLDSYFKGL